jgi:hypothetical protein
MRRTPKQEYSKESVPLSDGLMMSPTNVELVAKVLFMSLPEVLGRDIGMPIRESFPVRPVIDKHGPFKYYTTTCRRHGLGLNGEFRETHRGKITATLGVTHSGPGATTQTATGSMIIASSFV